MMYKPELTDSWVFLLPGLEIDRKRLSTTQIGLLGVYLLDLEHDVVHNNCLYLLFNPTDRVLLGSLMDDYKQMIVDEYDYDDGFMVAVFEFPSQHMVNYNLFMEGKYSQFLQQYKDLFPKLQSVSDKIVLQSMGIVSTKPLIQLVFERSPIMRQYWEDILDTSLGGKENEVWPIFDSNKESLDIARFYKQKEQEI